MTNESTNTYPPPIDKLLTYGDARNVHDWPDYQQLGFGPEHVPDLIRVATDKDLLWADSDSLEVWAPIHAWRTLGQLRAEAAIQPLTAYLADPSHLLFSRVAASGCLQHIGAQHPEARAECIAAITRQLEQFDENDPTLNGDLIASLLDLKAVESAPVIERAFAAKI